jgi:Uma2 family endonuclease
LDCRASVAPMTWRRTMTTTTRPMTAEELLNMPDDGFRYELVRGELRKMAPAGHDHGRIAASVAARLYVHVTEGGLGEVYAAETGFRLESDPDHVRAPDTAFVRRERAEAARGTPGFFPGAPDVAVEVISPSDSYTEVEEKVADWLGAGTLAVVVVDPRRRTVKVHRSLVDAVVLTEADVLAIEDVVPGWRVPVKDIFK